MYINGLQCITEEHNQSNMSSASQAIKLTKIDNEMNRPSGNKSDSVEMLTPRDPKAPNQALSQFSEHSFR